MKTYTATVRATGEKITVKAESYEEAAQHAINRLVSRDATAQRVTGDSGKSGMFQGYKYSKKMNGSTSIGGNIHIMEN
jgi:hypothetical protein